jgi:hypothetical protein
MVRKAGRGQQQEQVTVASQREPREEEAHARAEEAIQALAEAPARVEEI